MRRPNPWLILPVIAVAVFGMGPASAGAVVRLGPDLVPAPIGGIGCQPGIYSPCAYVNYESANAEAAAVSPSSGIVTEWRFRVGCCTEAQTKPLTMTLKTFRFVPSGDGYIHLEPVATGPSFVIPPGDSVLAEPVELPAHLPIAAGERVGIVADYPIEFATYGTANAMTTILSTGFTYGYAYKGAMAINADVEPDGDGDGYGDETQDCNPSDPSQTGACAPVFTRPPNPVSVSVSNGCSSGCGPAKAVTFPRPPQSVPSPRGDGGIEISLACPPESTLVCGGILYIELPKKKSPRATAAAAAPTVLARTPYSVAPGKKKKITVKFSKRVLAFLAQKRTRKVLVTLQPKTGPAVTTAETLHYPKQKP